MSGFAGFNGFFKHKENTIKKMLDKIEHRGLYEEAFLMNDSITLGYRSSNSLPYIMSNEGSTIFIVFDGKIYNHNELRKSLKKQGYFFKTNSDTELLIHLYDNKGISMLNDLRGMFSFCIYDYSNKELYAVRDHFGIKPLYYTVSDEVFIFASEIKSILEYPLQKQLNLEALEHYLSFQYSVLEETFFKNIFKLDAGHYIKFKDGKIEKNQYFDPIHTADNELLQTSVTELSKVIENSMIIHNTIDDESEIGVILSNDINSNYISINNQDKTTFTVSFNYNENEHVDEIKNFCSEFDIQNKNKIINKMDYIDTLPKVLYHLDEPIGDLSAVTDYLSYNFAKNYVDIVLVGDGLDEICGGHDIYNEPFHISFITVLPKPIRKILANIVNIIPFTFTGKSVVNRASRDVEERFIGINNIFSKEERDEILLNPLGAKHPQEVTKPFYDKVNNLDDVSKMQYIDMKLFLVQNVMLKTDKLSMANCVEARLPFLDKQVFDVLKKIPSDYRVNKQSNKYVFRMLAKEKLPDNICSKVNQPFRLILKDWLKEDTFYDKIKLSFTSKTAHKYFNVENILSLLDNHKNGKGEFTRKIWTIYTFLVWHDQFFDEI